MKLILFSGGVESTALLTKASPEDIALVIEPTFTTELPTYRRGVVETLAKRFGVKLAYARAQIPDLGGSDFVHQMTTFISIASIAVTRNSKISEVWCGRNSLEPAEGIRDYIQRNMRAWQLLHPQVPFLHSLDHLTKQEQWNLIPEDVKPLVSSCIHHNFCGSCYKCKEWTWILENLPSNT